MVEIAGKGEDSLFEIVTIDDKSELRTSHREYLLFRKEVCWDFGAGGLVVVIELRFKKS